MIFPQKIFSIFSPKSNNSNNKSPINFNNQVIKPIKIKNFLDSKKEKYDKNNYNINSKSDREKIILEKIEEKEIENNNEKEINDNIIYIKKKKNNQKKTLENTLKEGSSRNQIISKNPLSKNLSKEKY